MKKWTIKSYCNGGTCLFPETHACSRWINTLLVIFWVQKSCKYIFLGKWNNALVHCENPCYTSALLIFMLKRWSLHFSVVILEFLRPFSAVVLDSVLTFLAQLHRGPWKTAELSYADNTRINCMFKMVRAKNKLTNLSFNNCISSSSFCFSIKDCSSSSSLISSVVSLSSRSLRLWRFWKKNVNKTFVPPFPWSLSGNVRADNLGLNFHCMVWTSWNESELSGLQMFHRHQVFTSNHAVFSWAKNCSNS